MTNPPLLLRLTMFEVIDWKMSGEGPGSFRAKVRDDARRMAREAGRAVVVLGHDGGQLARVEPDAPSVPAPAAAAPASVPAPAASPSRPPAAVAAASPAASGAFRAEAPRSAHRLRPFRETVGVLGGDIGEIAGEVRDGFRVTFFDASVSLPVLQIGSDERGPFALLDGCSVAFPNGALLSLAWADPAAGRSALRIHDAPSPASSGVIDDEAAWSLRFDADGKLEPTDAEQAVG